MSIEQKIAEILAESKKQTLVEETDVEEIVAEEAIEEGVEVAGKEGGSNSAKENASAQESKQGIATDGVTKVAGEEENNKRNAVVSQDAAANATSKKENKATANASAAEPMASVKEDVDALLNGEELSEEFKQKATTIFEAAVMSRVKNEVARIEEEFETKLQEATEQIKEGLVEQVDGYLDYVVEQWMAQNEIALEHGIKSEILESFVAGMKNLFEEHYIDIPEEKYDVLGEMEQQIEQLSAKLDEQVAANVEMKKTLSEMKRAEIIDAACEGLTDTEVEKFTGLAEELSFEDAESFQTKVQTIRENYFNTKAKSADVASVVSDTPVESLNETTKVVDPTMKAYLSVLNRK